MPKNRPPRAGHPAAVPARGCRGRRAGFALVSTLMLMFLVTLLGVAMLSLSAISLRNAAASSQHAIARANAKLALMVAIGELQKQAGPDQRITASAGILDPTPDTAVSEEVAHPMWLGCWDSWTGWLNDPEHAATYTKGRLSNFRSWLVSHGDPSAAADPESAMNASSGSDMIELVGAGTLGPDAEDHAKVRAPRVTTREGSYAWWVGGENQKARFGKSEEPEDRLELIHARSAWPESDLTALDGLANLEIADEVPGKTPSLASLEIVAAGNSGRDTIRRHYHDLTTDSSGVLADVRRGGLKKDLNLLLERQSLPSEFGSFRASNPGGSIVPIRSESEQVPAAHYGGLNPNFSSWYKLHQYYAHYRGGGDETAADCVPLPFRRGAWNPDAPSTNFHWDRGNFDRFGLARTPILSRVMMVFSTRRVRARTPGRYDYKLGVNPVVAIWNPYNVTLRAGRLFIEIGPGAIEYKAYIDDTPAFDWKQVKLSQRADGDGTFKVRVYPMEGPGPAYYDTPIVLKPGETRLYSARSGFVQAENQYHVELYPGYQPPEADGGFDVVLDGCRNLTEDARVELAMRISDARHENGGVHQLYYVARNAQTGDAQRYSEFACNPIGDGAPLAVIEDAPGKRMVCPKSDQRVSFASFQIVLKSGEDLRSPGDNADYRCKNFIQANPVNQRATYGEATPRMKGMSQYHVHIDQGAGNSLNPDFDPATNRAYLGSAISLGNSRWPGQTAVVTTELPVAPVTSIASFMHFKLNPGRTSHATEQHLWDVAANQALGIGNSFAHPLIPATSVYQDVPDLAARGGDEWLEFKLPRDCYDRAYLANDALWDEWFCSTMTPEDRGIYQNGRDLGEVARDFAAGEAPLANPHLRPWRGGVSETELLEVFASGRAPAEDAWREASSHLMLDGAFNINTASVDAWKMFLWGLRGGNLAHLDADGNVREREVPDDRVAFSRFSLPCSDEEGGDPGDPASWQGIRLLTERQIDRLAEECVRQVKLRGPFLNLSDFVNRRLEDGEFGLSGALQAAIDWDDDEGQSSGPESINGRFKSSDDMIGTGAVADWGLPFPDAAAGSRFTGIPGYLTQADVLKRIGNMIAPRDDTFRIRAYGDARDAGGRVTARAWCEAVVQRVPEYLDAADAPHTAADELTSEINRRFGRRFQLVSFRWLNANTI